MTTSTSDSRRSARRAGFAGCLAATLAGGVGFVLFALGLAPATREALPFGIGLLMVGVAVGLFGSVRLLQGLSADAPAREAALGPTAARPPSTVSCPSCGGSAPVRVAEPTHSTCPFCHTRFALAAEMAALLQHAAALLRRQSESERQAARSVANLAARQRGWVIRVLLMATGLCAVAFLCAVYGFIARTEDEHWYAWLSFGLTSMTATGVLALLAILTVPPWMRRILGRWSALRIPGVEGLACRECGAPLPPAGTPVLRCSYCAADNVAGSDVLVRLAAGARSASRNALAVADRRRVGDEIAAAGFIAFPVLVLLAWFATGAAAGSVVIALAHDVELEPDGDLRYAVVRVEPGQACVAAMRVNGDKTIVYLRAGSRVEVSSLADYTVRPPVDASWLVGKQVTGSGRVVSVFRRLQFLTSHVLRTERGSEVYLPWPEGGGQLVCLDMDAGPGTALPAVQ